MFCFCLISACHFWLPVVSRATHALFKLFRFRSALRSCTLSPFPVSFLLCPSVSLSVYPCRACLSLFRSVSSLLGGWSVDFWHLSVQIHATRSADRHDRMADCGRIIVRHLGSFVTFNSLTRRYVLWVWRRTKTHKNTTYSLIDVARRRYRYYA